MKQYVGRNPGGRADTPKGDVRAEALAPLLLLWCSCAYALNPSLDISQYAHNAWTVRDGFFRGAIHAIAQTPDGYLWLGTEFGLLRFDGVRPTRWQPPDGERLPSPYVNQLLATKDGRLWIGTRAGLASWKESKLTQYPELAGQFILSLLSGQDGTIWVGGVGSPSGRLCAIEGARTTCYGADGRFGAGVFSLYPSRSGIWVGAATGLWRWIKASYSARS